LKNREEERWCVEIVNTRFSDDEDGRREQKFDDVCLFYGVNE